MAWWPSDQWQRMLAGEDCPMCADAHLETNAASDLIAELPATYARLARNQTHPGYSVVILKRHASELHRLAAHELAAFWTDVAAVGAVVDELFAPVKLHYLVMGSRAPHLHAHVFPHYADGDPFANVDISEGDVRLDEVNRLERVAAMRTALLRKSRQP